MREIDDSPELPRRGLRGADRAGRKSRRRCRRKETSTRERVSHRFLTSRNAHDGLLRPGNEICALRKSAAAQENYVAAGFGLRAGLTGLTGLGGAGGSGARSIVTRRPAAKP